MIKLINAVGVGLIFFAVFLVVFNILFSYEHEVRPLALLALGALVTGLGMGAVGNCRKS
jgi:hypothetical protein